MKAPILSALAAAGLLLPCAARAQTADVTPDVKCVVASVALTQSPDPQVKTLAQIATVYFLGKVDKGAPTLDLESKIKEAMGSMTPQTYPVEAQRCAQEFQARAMAVQTVFQHIQASQAPPAAGAAPAAPKPKP
jgi:hypothetical protein